MTEHSAVENALSNHFALRVWLVRLPISYCECLTYLSELERWGRELTVGCPVVVSPLPREWSC